MKRISVLKTISFIIIFLGMLGLTTVNVTGAETVSEFNGSKYRVTSIVEENLLFGGIKHTKYNAESSYTRNTEDKYIGKTTANQFYAQSVNTLEIPNNGKAKVVQWTYLPSSSTFGWTLTTVTKMASNYELYNPGYKVIAAINGDFFDINSNGGYGPLLKTTRGVGVSDGEVIRAMDARGLENNPLTIGFKNNGKSDNYVQGGKIEFSEYHMLTLYDEEDNVIDELEIKYINSEPSDGEIAVYFSYPTGVNPDNKAQGYELVEMPANSAYICENPSRLVPSSDTVLYAKGSLIEATETKDLAWGTFGIVTTNQEIRSKIDSATTVRVQRNVIGDYADCDNIGGGVFPLLLNGQKFFDQDTVHHPRTMIGAKADGSIVMATVDGRQKSSGMHGMTSDELGATMQYYGCVSAVNLDGGGSTTIMIRDENDQFRVLNSPSDGSLRRDSNCYLVVAKEADFKVDSQEVTSDKITLNLDTTNVDFNEVTSIKCTLNGVTKEVVDNKVTFDGLDSNKEYKYTFSYDTLDKKDIEVMLYGNITTSKQIPTFGELKAEVEVNKITFTPNINDLDGAVSSYVIKIGDKEETYSGTPVEIPLDLTDLTKVEFDVLVAYDLNDGSGVVETTEKYVCILETGKVYLSGEEPDDPVDNPTDNPGDNPGDEPTDDPVDEPTDKPVDPSDDEESGCKKDASMVIISLISLSSLLVLIKKRK